MNEKSNGEDHNNKIADDLLYDRSLLDKLDFHRFTCFKTPISPSHPGDGLRVRPLAQDDYDKGEKHFNEVAGSTSLVAFVRFRGSDKFCTTNPRSPRLHREPRNHA